jgi:hypothetical protein
MVKKAHLKKDINRCNLKIVSRDAPGE